jgi:long-chain-fatty-acid--CoA ligase ACSBG
MGFNSPQWFFSVIGAIFAGGVGCGIYTTNSLEAIEYIVSDSKGQIFIVENKQYLDKILKLKGKVPIKAIIQYNDEKIEDNHDGLVMTVNKIFKKN